MSLDYEPQSFTGMLLAAMPAVRDATFGGSVVLICAHSQDGAMGLIVNSLVGPQVKPAGNGDIISLLAEDIPIHLGGPAETDRPFVLHSDEWSDGDETLRIDSDHALTASSTALTAIANGDGPRKTLVALGYSAWGPGQLESEVMSNIWMTTHADPAIVFGIDCAKKWDATIRSVGILPGSLSMEPGHA
jgi:putative transcriptional regulator